MLAKLLQVALTEELLGEGERTMRSKIRSSHARVGVEESTPGRRSARSRGLIVLCGCRQGLASEGYAAEGQRDLDGGGAIIPLYASPFTSVISHRDSLRTTEILLQDSRVRQQCCDAVWTAVVPYRPRPVGPCD